MSRWKIAGILAAILAVAGLLIVIVALAIPDTTDAPERVRLEIRCNRAAKVRIDAKPAGETPVSITVRKGTQAIKIEATVTLHLMPTRAHQSIEVPETMTRSIVPDRDQTIDFVAPLKPSQLPDM